MRDGFARSLARCRYVGITRVKLQEALLTGAAEVRQRLGVSLKALTQHDSGVEVHFSDGTSGAHDLVVGADGIRSTARALAIASFPLRTMLGRWFGEASSRHPQGTAEMMVLMGEKSFFGVVPMGEGHTYGFVVSRH
ncbi:MAG: FAD-dependent monooxygenase [Alphaproteobacteria bacterium]|nr:FAD-dependent monooxygenase [Alphaproteobacteria bacterium]